MRATARFILTPQEPEEETRLWDAQKGGNTKIHFVVDAHGMPVRVVITKGTKADCSQAGDLIDGIKAEYLLADRAYDTYDILDKAKSSGMTPIIPQKKP